MKEWIPLKKSIEVGIGEREREWKCNNLIGK